jgi:septum formation protein
MSRDKGIWARNLCDGARVLTLASRSPRRRAILTQLGIEFEVAVPDVEELTGGDPRELVIENARRKAMSVRGDLVLGADTVVALDGAILGKPGDEEEARRHLTRLSARTHEVWTGVALGERTMAVKTNVAFADLTELLDWYLASGEWEGKAGAYAIQGRGAALVESIEGDYTNVVGLPVTALVRLMGSFAGGSRPGQ